MAQLAIQGHRTRGSEVIALLEMLGGKNKRFFNCARQTCVYFIGDDNDISMLYLSLADEKFVVFTIEEFETKFPYKVGNKVTYDGWNCTVIGMEWENNTNTILYTVKGIDFCKYTCVEDLHSHKEEKTYPPYMDYDVTTKEQPKEGLVNLKDACDMNWQPIDRDENGFATEECLDRISNNLPCAVCHHTERGFKYYHMVGENLDMMHNLWDIQEDNTYTHYLLIPKLEV